MIRIGLTGGIGSGKSTVASIFAVLGIPIFNADIEAKRIMIEDKSVINEIKNLLGENSYTNNALNTNHISQMVFDDNTLLQKLNRIVHPAVHKDAIKWHKEQKNYPYTLYEAALIYETESESTFDFIITVYANQKTCIKRVMKRNGMKRKDVLSRIHKQMSSLEKKRRADFVILNNDKDSIIKQVLNIHHKLRKGYDG